MEEQSRSFNNNAVVFRAERLLRVGLVFVLWYAAYRGFLDPNSWVGFIPASASAIADPYALLSVFEAGQVFVGFWLLAGWKVRWAAAISSLFFIGIVVTNYGAFDIVFRDVTMIFAAVSLWVLAGYRPLLENEEAIR
ncbi:MAG: DoxX family membrane protein [Candidatus Vogelbacteria bacterium]|nr:DoxX family membrane protein [Candidatus Vogelbacteria bacterium]